MAATAITGISNTMIAPRMIAARFQFFTSGSCQSEEGGVGSERCGSSKTSGVFQQAVPKPCFLTPKLDLLTGRTPIVPPGGASRL
jgi:hypothetical protein